MAHYKTGPQQVFPRRATGGKIFLFNAMGNLFRALLRASPGV